MYRAIASLLAFFVGTLCFSEPFTLTILHTNDMHAHAEATKVRDRVLGGYARQATLILREREKADNTLLLNGGDVFQGTMFFNTYEGLADLAYMNAIGYQAMAVGNHEFDRGPATLAKFVKNASFPVLSANLDFSAEPLLRDLVKPSAVVEVGGQRIGIVGATTPDVTNISSPGPNVKVKDLVTSIQEAVDGLMKEKIDKIILVSHCGYDVEQDLAKKIHGLDLVVGGHSHTLLGDTGLKGFVGKGPYPTVVEGADGQKVLVVQAWEWGKVLGRIQVTFDDEGHIKSWDGAPIPVTEDVPEAPFVTALYAAFAKPIEAQRAAVVGQVSAPLTRSNADGTGSSMGDVIADAMLEATKKFGAVAAFTNAGGVRADLAVGPVTYSKALEVAPFANTLVLLELTGAELKAALDSGAGEAGMLYPSVGTSYAYDPSKPAGQRVTDLVVAGQPVDLTATYTITFNSFIAGGGDKHDVIKEAKGKRTDTGLVDLDVLIDYFKAHSPVGVAQPRRLKRLGGRTAQGNPAPLR